MHVLTLLASTRRKRTSDRSGAELDDVKRRFGELASNIATTSAVYEKYVSSWAMTRALMGGTAAMRMAGRTYLPQNLFEEGKDYRDRLDRATLAPFYRKTVSNLAGRIFAKPVALQDDVPKSIKEWCENIDRQGSNITVFFGNAARKGIDNGSVGILADYPKAEGVPTLADERGLGARPYLTIYPAESILYVRFDDAGKLIEARLMEIISEPNGEFGEEEVRQIRRLLRDSDGVRYEIWRTVSSPAGNSGEWEIVSDGPMTIDEIPLALVYLNPQDTHHDSPPPLLDLAYLCVKHWQDQSAQDNVAEVARFPIFAASGWNKDEDVEIVLGPKRMVATSEPGGRFYYVEHSGAAIAAGRAELERLEDQIAMEGIRPLTRQRTANGATATQIQSEDQNVKSEAQLWGEKIKDAVETCLMFMAKWAGLGDDAGGSVDMTGDFNFVDIDAATLSSLQQMRSSGDLSRQTLWEEFKRRGILSDGFDAEAEQVRIDEEPPDFQKSGESMTEDDDG
jgi:hypothetical protein